MYIKEDSIELNEMKVPNSENDKVHALNRITLDGQVRFSLKTF